MEIVPDKSPRKFGISSGPVKAGAGRRRASRKSSHRFHESSSILLQFGILSYPTAKYQGIRLVLKFVQDG